MNVAMFTNTYLPHVGGVARSVSTFAEALRAKGHRVLVVAPKYDGPSRDEAHVVRLPAMRQRSGFSVRVPVPGLLKSALDAFEPDVIHAHHPFLIGETARRIAFMRDLPLVFTHHTLYEHYTHYVPVKSKAMGPFIIRLGTAYANGCDHVVAPSESVRDLLVERGVTTPVSVVPTGIDVKAIAGGRGARLRRRLGIPAEAFVVGHVGRLAPEKNLEFMARAVALFMKKERAARFLVAGVGPSEESLRSILAKNGLLERFHPIGILQGRDLADAYRAMDVFAFASESETQGLVLAEAMAASVPVVAQDASGAREVVMDKKNGRLLEKPTEQAFARALSWVASQADATRERLAKQAHATARELSTARCATRLVEVYAEARRAHPTDRSESGAWSAAQRLMESEWEHWVAFADSARGALAEERAHAKAARRATRE